MTSSSRDKKLESTEVISNEKLTKLMRDAFIPGLSVAFILPDKKIETHALGVASLESEAAAIAEYLTKLTVGDIHPSMSYLSSKYGYQQTTSPDWQKNSPGKY